ncbi:hypothetical protein Coch_2082 [Capnocytophaga ochracea DSM 7271]|uniref:Phospholipase D-like domain-containing protein n=1 Tax=Capnocytophaga ochracea (strain ATCC 27872 / DSM 7271 / CCUG 9716 / JCM 12966 / NCTC 12371 / SS31 / VPI 2845) TaxID=521097 RepID=C7M3K0_CAPOD|nr:hypothetical protein [Capnocytophaga ochracea]ACU93626.1 hypothetical protein Coch_2082 [Capnocytophaga ochracea DSM 7271]UAK50241.1 hypothetical protein K8O87_05565 [Capnocytophaga ochracea]
MDFLTGKPLSDTIYDTLFKAEKELIIISPYIQLGDYLKDNVFKQLLNNTKLHILIGFGKNTSNGEENCKREDIEYFLGFPNITMVYIPQLHGQYYANEKQSVITSMNLLDYSLENKVEFGVLAEKALTDLVNKNNFFETSKNTIMSVLDSGYTIFAKRPNYNKKFLGLAKDYAGSTVHLDLVDDVLSNREVKPIRYSSFVPENYANAENRPPAEREPTSERAIETETPQENAVQEEKKGHCIRCNTAIPFDPSKPLYNSCYEEWVKFGNRFYEEKYCHCCGEEKKVTVATPLCYNCFSRQL